MQSVIKIGSRESRLAVKQAEIIRDQIISEQSGDFCGNHYDENNRR